MNKVYKEEGFSEIEYSGERKKVLLIGDSISIGYRPFVKEYLADEFDVTYPNDNCRNTHYVLTSLRTWVNMFEDASKQLKGKAIQEAMLHVRAKYGKNAILKGMNLEEGATAMKRNSQIGGLTFVAIVENDVAVNIYCLKCKCAVFSRHKLIIPFIIKQGGKV